jgi:YVTN family beta-propeller protein
VATIPVGAAPHRFPAFGLGTLWVPNSGDATVSRIAPESNRVVATIPTGGTPQQAPNGWDPVAVAVDDAGGEVWVTVVAGRAVARIDPQANAVTQVVPVGVRPFGLAIASGALWVAAYEDNAVVRVDLSTREVAATLPRVPRPGAVVAADGAVWVVNHQSNEVTRIDPSANEPTGTVSIGRGGPNPACGLCAQNAAAGEGSVWTANATGHTVTRIDPQTGQVVATIPARGAPFGIAVGAGAVRATLVEQAPVRELGRIDIGTNQLQRTISLPGATQTGPMGVIVGGDAVWVTYLRGNTVFRIDPTR